MSNNDNKNATIFVAQSGSSTTVAASDSKTQTSAASKQDKPAKPKKVM